MAGSRPKGRREFDRSSLPAPSEVLRQLGVTIPAKHNEAGYWAIICPFHKDGMEKNPSMNMHAYSGHYRCHACGAKGGDVLAFYMEHTGKKFFDAVTDLGAWRII